MTRIVPLALALVGLAPGVAHAQAATVPPTTVPSTTAADATFEEGRALLERGRFAEACAKFKTTWDAKATPGKAFNLSACEEKQGHVVRAASWMVEGTALLEPTDERRPSAIERRAELDRRAAQLTVLANPSARASSLLVDAAPFELGSRAPIDPGKHRIVARLEGYDDVVVDLSLSEGETKPVTLPAFHRTPSRDRGAPAAMPDEALGRTQRGVGIASMVLGGASLAGFGVMAGVVASKHGAFADEPLGTQRSTDLAHLGRRLEIAEGVLLGVGIAAAATGVVLFATAPSGEAKRTAGLRMKPVFDFDANGASGGIAGSF